MTPDERNAVLDAIEDNTTSLDATATTYATLLAALKAMTAAAASVTQVGNIKNTGADGAFVEFFGASEYDPGPQGQRAVAGRIRQTYRDCIAILDSAGNPTPTDREIFDEMRDRLTPVREIAPTDFSCVGL